MHIAIPIVDFVDVSGSREPGFRGGAEFLHGSVNGSQIITLQKRLLIFNLFASDRLIVMTRGRAVSQRLVDPYNMVKLCLAKSG